MGKVVKDELEESHAVLGDRCRVAETSGSSDDLARVFKRVALFQTRIVNHNSLEHPGMSLAVNRNALQLTNTVFSDQVLLLAAPLQRTTLIPRIEGNRNG